jgi:hypothetical protein
MQFHLGSSWSVRGLVLQPAWKAHVGKCEKAKQPNLAIRFLYLSHLTIGGGFGQLEEWSGGVNG